MTRRGKGVHRAELALGITSLGSPIKQQQIVGNHSPIPVDEWDARFVFLNILSG